MKKVLILSYFFTPCNLTASQRAYGWAKYMKKYGYYPVIITRNWDNPISTPADVLKKSGVEIKHEITNDYEVYYLPYSGSLRDRFFVKYGETRFGFFRRFLTFFEIFLENFSNRFIPFRNLYSFAKEYIKTNNDVERIVITANPFTMFRFGYLLHKEFGIKWLADYRDDWNTSDFIKNKTFFERLLNALRASSEKRWVGTAECITTVSDAYQEKISDFVKKQGYVLLNGYFAEDYGNTEKSMADVFTIVYNGSLYPTQEIEIFLAAFKNLIDKRGRNNTRIKIVFPGLLFDKSQAYRVKNYMQGYEEFIEILPRIPQKQVFELQAKSHLFLMIAHKGLKGIPSSKLYEYIGFGKPIIACPSDNDIIEDTLKDYNIGSICDSTQEAYTKLEELYNVFEQGEYEKLTADRAYQQKFTREHSSKQITEILNEFYLPELGMKRALILAHDFPPYTSIGALRPASWYRYFKDSGIYPVVVTRRWDNIKQNVADVVKPSQRQYVGYQHSPSGTVVRVPYKPNYRDKLILRYGIERFNFLRRGLTFFYSLTKFIWRRADNTDIIYQYARKVIQENKIDVIIATGEPFILFKYGYFLSKEFNIRWIADYRDGWTTNSVNIPRNIIEKLINNFFERCEKIYLSNVFMITNASPTYASDFQLKYPSKKVNVIFNGYDKIEAPEQYESIQQTDDVFSITYAGILYPYHQLEMFLEGYKRFIEITGCQKTKLLFLGIEFYSDQRDRILNYDKSLNKYITTTQRIPHEDVLKELRKSNLLLLLTNENAKSLHAKVFEYMMANRKILLVKNDRGVLESIIKECEAGVALSSAEEVTKELVKNYEEFLTKGYIEQHTVNLEKYSRSYQAHVLADLILN